MSTAMTQGRTSVCTIRSERSSTYCTPTPPTHPGARCSRPGAASGLRRSPWRSEARTLGSPRSTSPRTRSPKPGDGPTGRDSPTWGSGRRTSSPCPSAPSPSTTSSSASSWSTSRGLSRPWRFSTGCSGPVAPSPLSRAITDRPTSIPQPRRLRGDPVPGRAAEGAGGNALIGRQLYPLMVEARFDAVGVSPPNGVRRLEPTRSGRWFHEEDVHRHDRGRSRVRHRGWSHRAGDLRCRGPGSPSNDRGGRCVLLHVLQGRGREEATGGLRLRPASCPGGRSRRQTTRGWSRAPPGGSRTAEPGSRPASAHGRASSARSRAGGW